ncbi:phage major capsid protein [Alcaligenes sp. SDU_A2]|uniref:phage major capsid protein n=1 Tax=Alcaligenes sp. SDU_A2 TaxID=3136634 RepID=UPI00312033F6
MKLHEIREARATKVAEARSLLEAHKTLTADQQTAFDKLKADIQDLEQQESRQQFIDDMERRQAGAPVDGGGDNLAALEKRVSLLDVLRTQMEGRSLTGAAAEYTQETERRTGRKAQGAFVPLALLEQRAANDTTSAKELVPTTHRPDLYIPALRERLVARQLGVRVLTGLTGNLSIPKYGSGLATGWVAEGGAVPDGQMGFDSVGLSPKHVGGKTEMSRQLLQQSSPDIEQLVRDDLAFLIAKQIDAAIIAGTGTANDPVGVLNMAGIQSGSLATLDWPAVLAFAQKLEDEEIYGGAWLTTAKAKNKFASTLKAVGLPGYLLEGGMMADRPLVTSKRVPSDVAGETVILGDFSQILLGVWSELDILVNPFAEPAYSRGGVVVRAMATVGTACRHEQAFVVANDLA